ncbi:Bpu10I family restriction endonuclease [Vibrio fluvialis]|nr:Bpu10I family restriction endonuclease [Vibrio fluvialis]
MEILYPHNHWFEHANHNHKRKPEFAKAKQAYEIYRDSLRAADDINDEYEYIRLATEALNTYKDVIDLLEFKKAFNAQTKFHSTVHEEFWGLISLHLISALDLPLDQARVYIGPGQSLQGLYFHPESPTQAFGNQLGNTIKPKFKDRDFMIALKTNFDLSLNHHKSPLRTSGAIRELFLPLVTIECKQYIDKTMMDNALSAATKLKAFSPFTLDIVTIELNKLSDVNIAGSGVDGFYILRKQKLSEARFRNGDGPKDTVDVTRRKPLDCDVIFKVYEAMKNHLTSNRWYYDEDSFFEQGLITNSL